MASDRGKTEGSCQAFLVSVNTILVPIIMPMCKDSLFFNVSFLALIKVT